MERLLLEAFVTCSRPYSTGALFVDVEGNVTSNFPLNICLLLAAYPDEDKMPTAKYRVPKCSVVKISTAKGWFAKILTRNF